MSSQQPKRELAVGEKAYVPVSCTYVRLPGHGVYIHRFFYVDGKSAGDGAAMVERVSANKYRILLPAGFRAQRYSESEAHIAPMLPMNEVVDEEGGTHTTMPSKYLTL